MRFGVLGPLRIYSEDGVGSPVPVAQHRRLLAILLLRANQTVTFDEIANALWDGDPPAGHRPTVRNYVRLLRRTLGPELAGRLITRAPGYLIEVADDELDMWQFTRLCRRGREAMRAQAWSDAHDQLAAALALWRGPAFADVASRWIQDSEVFPLTELRLQACEWRIEVDLQLGRGAELVGELQLLVHQHPLRERLRAQLMLALHRSGRKAEALEVYRRPGRCWWPRRASSRGRCCGRPRARAAAGRGRDPRRPARRTQCPYRANCPPTSRCSPAGPPSWPSWTRCCRRRTSPRR